MDRSSLKPFSTWRHVKTDSLYVVLGIGTCSTNGPNEHREESVIYVSLSHQHLCYREISEFLDGRFVPATCNFLVRGDYCKLPAGHEGGHKWGRGD